MHELKARRLGPLQISILVLAIGSGLVHLYRGVSMLLLTRSFQDRPVGAPRNRPPGQGGFSILQALPLPLSTLFILNFVGYAVLATALYLPPLERYRSIIRWVL